VFDIDEFRPGQEDVIRAVLSGRDTLAIMPTGAGKSLCYQLPGLFLKGITVVVSPLISLMKDQTDKLNDLGLGASQVNSALTRRETDDSLAHICGDAEFALTTPERLAADAAFVSMLRTKTIDRFVVDEAHCVSEWGHDFRPAYLELRRVIDELGRPPVLALTATATSAVVDDIISALGLRDPAIVSAGIYRPNLHLSVVQTPNDADKRLRLVEALRRLPGTGIVYAATVKDVEAVTRELTAAGFAAARYHGRVGRRERHDNQDRFMAGELKAMVATNAFGMGIDKRDIRFVIHYSMPGSLEAYYQEAGRSGRDGADADCALFFNIKDRRTHRYFIAGRYRGVRTRLERKGLDPDTLAARVHDYDRRRQRDEEKLERMILYAQSPSCRWRAILEYFGEDLAPDFKCRSCDACLHPPEFQIAPPAADVVESPLPPPEEPPRALGIGRKVDVPEYGEGEIRGVDGDKVLVAFADGQTRKFKRDYF